MKAVLFSLMLLSTSVFADDDAPFDILELPEGASVTLPSPATTLVPLSTFYRVTPTDKAQVFRISSTSKCAVKIQVYDKTSDEVKTANLKSGESMIYRFERFNGVRVHAVPVSGCAAMTKLVLDSANGPVRLAVVTAGLAKVE